MTQKVKSSPSLKGILKDELGSEMRYIASDCRGYADKIGADLDSTMADRFYSVYARISDLEKAATDASISWEDLYWIIAVAAMLLIVIYFVIIKAAEQ